MLKLVRKENESVVDEENVFYRHSANEMAHLGDTKRENIEIWVFGGEGPVPHFYFKLKGDGKDKSGCLKLKEADYFSHGDHRAVLNSRELKDVIEYLKRPYSSHGFNPGWSNYDACCFEWNTNNPQFALERQEMPDYLTINKG